MRGYTTVKPLYVDLMLHPDSESATITGKKGQWTFQAGSIVNFRGLDSDTIMIEKVYPNGMRMINARSSVPMFLTWSQLFGKASGKHNSIWLDCANHTGWMDVT